MKKKNTEAVFDDGLSINERTHSRAHGEEMVNDTLVDYVLLFVPSIIINEFAVVCRVLHLLMYRKTSMSVKHMLLLSHNLCSMMQH
ncbi:CLUMA_CG020454, isoform A [Clunio marinus]|uniref:CLUMA_CG020454, isoform A n=1 Tax=Clunio marinus TaxID=568069 RepID=A0A1J1J7N8_9DIPT|nr:CLUMA_CG020454, isoform A [Clunio marinus]